MAHSDYIVGKTPGGELSPPSKPKLFHTGKDVLNHTMISTLIENDPKLVKGTTKDSVLHGFKLLTDNKILSIPLYDPELHGYVGFLDIIDVAYHFLAVLSKDEVRTGFATWQQKFSETSNKQVIDISGRNQWKGVDPSAPLQSIIDLLVHYKLHRIPVIDGEGSLVTVLSQSRVVQYLVQYMGLFAWGAKTVGEIQLGYRDVICVSSSMVTKDAFKVMRDARVSGVGVVDDNTKKLVGVLSTSDIRHVGYTELMFERFYLSVQDFIALVHVAHPHIPPVTVVTPTSTIAEVGSLFAKYRIHRLFVVESAESMKPVGVISLHDFLLLFGRPFH